MCHSASRNQSSGQLHRRLLATMLLSRESDLREDVLVRQGKAGPHVSSRGHEALMAITALLEPRDLLFPYYRGCHLMMGKGIARETIARDALYRSSSSSGGRSMSAHTGSRELGVFPSAAPVPAQCLPAVGAAWAQQREQQQAVTVCSLGDGATRAGEFYEAICFAVQEQLPILFVVEDNGWAISTSTKHMTPLALKVLEPSRWQQVDGTDTHAVLEATRRALTDMREGQGPQLMWCRVARLDPHTSNEDHSSYRSREELEQLVDPVERFAASLLERGELEAEELEAMREEAREHARAIYREASAEAAPDPADIYAHMYGERPSYRPVPIEPGPEPLTMVEATRQVLRAGLETFDEMIMFGQDIEDPKGGVFGFTKGLSSQFPTRVRNAPITEATIIGGAVGLAAAGLRPVFEIQFVDFLAPGFNQLVNQAASLRWRSLGQWTCPMVIYAPYGSYIPRTGLWHGQSNEGWWTHVPGLRVAVPSTPSDLMGLFWSAFQDEDPTLLLIPKFVFRVRHAPTRPEPIPFGQARLARAGRDLTLVAWGNAVALGERAAEQLAAEGIEVEVLDLRTLVPCDHAAIEASVARTGRLVVVQEDSRSASFGATIVSEIVSKAASFDGLLAPPQLVSREDVHIPCEAALMEAVLPTVQDIVVAVRATVSATRSPALAGRTGVASSPTPSAAGSLAVDEAEPANRSVFELLVPSLGEGIREVRIVELLKAPGESFVEDEALYELESAKATSSIEAPGPGRLLEWLVEVDDVLAVGEPVARLELSTESGADLPAASSGPSDEHEDPRLPASQALAYREVQLSPRQQQLNASFRRSRARAIPATIFSFLRLEGLAEGASKLLRELSHSSDGYVTAFEAFAFCASRATAAHPPLRSVFTGGDVRREYSTLQLGVAVHGASGDLLTAVVEHADQLSLPSFRDALRESINTAMEGCDQASEDTQLLLTYLGDLGVVGGVPLLTSPSAAVLSYGCPFPGQPEYVQLSLSFEHQIMNGIEAASFLQTLEYCVRELAAGLDPRAERPALLRAPLVSRGRPKLADEIRAMERPEHAQVRLEQQLAAYLTQLTGVPSDACAPDSPFAELGLSSLDLLQLRACIEKDLGVTVPIAVFWSAFTCTALASYLLRELRTADADSGASWAAEDARIAALDGGELIDELDRLLDDPALMK